MVDGRIFETAESKVYREAELVADTLLESASALDHLAGLAEEGGKGDVLKFAKTTANELRMVTKKLRQEIIPDDWWKDNKLPGVTE